MKAKAVKAEGVKAERGTEKQTGAPRKAVKAVKEEKPQVKDKPEAAGRRLRPQTATLKQKATEKRLRPQTATQEQTATQKRRKVSRPTPDSDAWWIAIGVRPSSVDLGPQDKRVWEERKRYEKMMCIHPVRHDQYWDYIITGTLPVCVQRRGRGP